MLNSPTCPLVKEVTMWAESVLTRSTEEGIPSSGEREGGRGGEREGGRDSERRKKQKAPQSHSLSVTSLLQSPSSTSRWHHKLNTLQLPQTSPPSAQPTFAVVEGGEGGARAAGVPQPEGAVP